MAISKPKLLQTLIPVLALFLIMLANKVQSQDTTAFNFDSFVPNPGQLTYQGDANVALGSNVLSLTRLSPTGSPQRSSVGRVVFTRAVRFWEGSASTARQAVFSTTIRYQIRSVNNDPADGIAFFIAPAGSTIPSGSAGGNLGIFGSSGTSSALFAVEFDTYVNTWDPRYRHIGIDINSRNSRAVTSFNTIGAIVTAVINYDPSTRIINVVATSGSTTRRLTHVIDLKTVLNQQVRVGISASTGDGIARHEILSWAFTSTLVHERNVGQLENEYNNQNKTAIVENEYNNQNKTEIVDPIYIEQYA